MQRGFSYKTLPTSINKRRNIQSNRKEVTSGIPQCSVLGPLLFVLYINDLPEAVESEAYLFADDTKIFRVINSLDDQQILQNNLVKLENWSDTWLL